MLQILVDLGACEEARIWAKDYADLQSAWDKCERGDWMLWLLQRSKDPDRKKIVRTTCDIARTVLHLIPANEDRPRLAIEAAEGWCEGKVSIETAYAAARAAADAAYAARAAAYAAADAADAADAAAAAAAAYAAAAAAAAAAASGLKQAHIVRKHFPLAPRF